MYEDQHHYIAEQAARRWYAKTGAKSTRAYEFNDLYQDAREVILRYQERYDPTKGSFESFMMRVCIRRLGDRLTRAVQPASTASNSEVSSLRELRREQVTETTFSLAGRAGYVQADYQPANIRHQLWLKELQERIAAVAGDDPLALAICLGKTSVRAEAKTPEESRKLHVRVRRVKRHLAGDRRLLTMYRDGHASEPVYTASV